MDTNKKKEPEFLDFTSFVKKYYPTFIFDEENRKLVSNLGLWATRNEKFNNLEDGWHIDRGLLLIGPFGVGKDEVFKMLKPYLSYLHSPYTFRHKVVWKYAKPYLDQGFNCFDDDGVGNIYYEELGLTDDKTGYPTREEVNRYGNKILVGSELIIMRYNIFKETAFQSHFSTNLTEDELERVYGARCISRLYEMCNVMIVKGKDRRGTVAPLFGRNLIVPLPPRPRDVTVDEHKENKATVDADYQLWYQTGSTNNEMWMLYNLMAAYKVHVATEEELQSYYDDYIQNFSDESGSGRETRQAREDRKKAEAWNFSRKSAVLKYFGKMKEAGAKSIFGEVEVDMVEVFGGLRKKE